MARARTSNYVPGSEWQRLRPPCAPACLPHSPCVAPCAAPPRAAFPQRHSFLQRLCCCWDAAEVGGPRLRGGGSRQPESCAPPPVGLGQLHVRFRSHAQPYPVAAANVPWESPSALPCDCSDIDPRDSFLEAKYGGHRPAVQQPALKQLPLSLQRSRLKQAACVRRIPFPCFDQARFGTCNDAFMRSTPEEIPEGAERLEVRSRQAPSCSPPNVPCRPVRARVLPAMGRAQATARSRAGGAAAARHWTMCSAARAWRCSGEWIADVATSSTPTTCATYRAPPRRRTAPRSQHSPLPLCPPRRWVLGFSEVGNLTTQPGYMVTLLAPNDGAVWSAIKRLGARLLLLSTRAATLRASHSMASGAQATPARRRWRVTATRAPSWLTWVATTWPHP
jgi:hypothetical protein